jgi:hypothetical protein
MFNGSEVGRCVFKVIYWVFVGRQKDEKVTMMERTFIY